MQKFIFFINVNKAVLSVVVTSSPKLSECIALHSSVCSSRGNNELLLQLYLGCNCNHSQVLMPSFELVRINTIELSPLDALFTAQQSVQCIAYQCFLRKSGLLSFIASAGDRGEAHSLIPASLKIKYSGVSCCTIWKGGTDF